MAEGISESTANGLLALMFQAASFSIPAVWVQLHIGAPGAAGTSNVAVNNTRMDASTCFGTAPAAGAITNDAVIGPWLLVPATETYTHASLWTGTSGVFFGSGAITAAAVTAGSGFEILIGDLSAAFPIAA